MPRVDARGKPLRAVTDANGFMGRVKHGLVLWVVGVLMLAAVVVMIGSVALQASALLRHVSMPWGLIGAIALLSLWVIAGGLYLSRDVDRGPPLRDTRVGPLEACQACKYPLDGSSPRREDGCVVCPECGAAWREPTEDAMPATWMYRERGWISNRKRDKVALLRQLDDDGLYKELGLPALALTRLLRALVLGALLVTAVMTMIAGMGQAIDPQIAMVGSVVQMLALSVAIGVLVQREWKVAGKRRRLLREGACPHCSTTLQGDPRSDRVCGGCGSTW
jgi:uncharacterized Zn finger protein (UPF0148 family)